MKHYTNTLFNNKKRSIASVLFVSFYILTLTSTMYAEETPITTTQDQYTQDQNFHTDTYKTISELYLPSLSKQMIEDDEKDSAQNKKNLENLQSLSKLMHVSLPEVQETEKLRLTYNIFSQYEREHASYYPSILTMNTIKDLDLFCNASVTAAEKNIFNCLDKTTTIFGKVQLQKMLFTPTSDIQQLAYRQEIIRTLVNDEALLQALSEQLETIAHIESHMLWFWKSTAQAIAMFMNSTNFPDWNCFTGLNESAKALQIYHLYTIASSLAWAVGEGYLAQKYITDFFTYTTAEQARTVFWILGLIFASAMSAYNIALTHNIGCVKHKKINNLAIFADATENLASIIGSNQELSLLFSAEELMIDQSTTDAQKLVSLLHTTTLHSDPGIFTIQGNALAAFNLTTRLKNNFIKTMLAVGKLDAYVSIAKLYKQFEKNERVHFCFADYLKADKPSLKINNFWHPQLNPDIAVPNNIELGNNNNAHAMIITGPNAGGKSTTLKAITIGILLAQTFGIAPATACALTPFSQISTYMNIADTTGSASLFQAEMRRTQSLIQSLKSLTPGDFAFIVMDEIFTGTNAKEGQAGAYGVAKKISSFDNNICLFATHFKRLTELERATNGIIENRKVMVIKNPDGSFTFPYKLEAGITDQAIAIDLLQQEGFDQEILDAAHEILKTQDTN